MTIPAVGRITALTWALEVGEAERFSSIRKAISYCGLCGAEKSSANTVQRTPLACQVLPVADWAREREFSVLPLSSFETGRKTPTQSSEQPFRGCDSKWKSGSIGTGTTA